VIFQNGIGRIAIQNDIVTDTDLFLAGGTTSNQRGNLTNSGLRPLQNPETPGLK
jgi:hypothetical protein